MKFIVLPTSFSYLCGLCAQINVVCRGGAKCLLVSLISVLAKPPIMQQAVILVVVIYEFQIQA